MHITQASVIIENEIGGAISVCGALLLYVRQCVVLCSGGGDAMDVFDEN